MSGVALVLHQFRFDQKVFWRNPASVFFTAIFPLLFLFIFASFFKNANIQGLGVHGATYYVPAIVAVSVISATTVKLAMNLSSEREAGQLKRVRGTPLPPATFVAGRVGNSLVISVIMVALISLIGAAFYGVTIPTDTLPALLVTLAVGVFSFSCLGFALAAAIPSEDAAPAVTNDPGRDPQYRLRLPRAALFSGSIHRLGPEHNRSRVRVGQPRRRRSLGRVWAARRGPLLPLGAPALTPGVPSHV